LTCRSDDDRATPEVTPTTYVYFRFRLSYAAAWLISSEPVTMVQWTFPFSPSSVSISGSA